MWLDIISSFCDMDWPPDMVKSYRWCSLLIKCSPMHIFQVGDEKKVQLLSRSLSGSKLNAKAPEFVPKGLAAFSTSLPGPIVQGLGFSPPTLVSVPSSVIPVIVPPPVVNVVLSPAVEEILVESPPSVDGVHPNETTEGCDLVLGQDLGGESEHSHAPAAAALTQVVKPVVTEELKAKIVKQVRSFI